ncbi:hypothetical protein MCBG_01985 [Micromonospora sp. M42]|nr:hypothetical protein MCBG_01985 [Micromonospora sp. M42]
MDLPAVDFPSIDSCNSDSRLAAAGAAPRHFSVPLDRDAWHVPASIPHVTRRTSMPRPQLRGPLRRAAHIGVIALVAVSSGLVPPPAAAGASVRRVTSTVTGSDGQPYRITNHLTRTAQAAERPGAPARQWLLVWTGDAAPGPDGKPDPDFLAVVDATPGSPDYGRVANTVTVDSVFGNEPHHMQYTWRKGDKVYAGGLLSDTVYVFDVSRLPRVSLSGVTLPHDTPCGSVPDAFTVLRDGTAYGSYMGGPDVAGPCTYSDGQTRVGNGFAGSPGEVVRLGPDGRVLAEMPAAKKTAEDPVSCPNQPALPVPTCANPHGIALREDLNRLVTSDFVEVRHVVAGLVTDPNLQRRTVRTYDISNRNRPRLLSLSYLPDGPRVDDEYSREGLLAMEARGDAPAPAQGSVRGHRDGRGLLHAGHHQAGADLAAGVRRRDRLPPYLPARHPDQRGRRRQLADGEPGRPFPVPHGDVRRQQLTGRQRRVRHGVRAGHPPAPGRRQPDLVSDRHDRGDRTRRRRAGLSRAGQRPADRGHHTRWPALGRDGHVPAGGGREALPPDRPGLPGGHLELLRGAHRTRR